MTMPQQRPGRSKQDYGTPPEFLTAMKQVLWIREFSHDFAADADTAVSSSFWSQAEDSLAQDEAAWRSKTGALGWGWLNPPFANIGPWAEKCLDIAYSAHIALLVPASVGSNWYRDFVHARARVLFLNGRLTFVGCNQPYPKDCLVALYGPDVKIGFDVFDWRNGCLR